MIRPEKIRLDVNNECDYSEQIRSIKAANKDKPYIFLISQLSGSKRQNVDIILMKPDKIGTEANCWRNQFCDPMQYHISNHPRTCTRSEFLDFIFKNHKECAEWFIWNLADYEVV